MASLSMKDIDFLEENHEYASTAKDLDAMMHLAVDEGKLFNLAY